MIKVKLISKPRSGTPSSVGRPSGIRYAGRGTNADYATESGHAKEADFADNASLAAEAAHAASSAGLDKDSSVWSTIQQWIDTLKENCLKWFLRKDVDDTAGGLITFLKGFVSNAAAKFLKGFTVGNDGKYGVDGDGNATANSLCIGKYGIDEAGKATLRGIVAEYFRSDDFRQGYLGGSGFGEYKDADGKSVVETDKLIVRMKAIFAELEIRKLSYVGGDQVKSFAGSRIVNVVPLDATGKGITDSSTPNAYKCYFLDDDGTTRTENWWKVGDQARCQTFDIESGTYKDVSNRYYWRLVTATGSEDVDIDGTTKHMGFVVLSNNSDGFTIADPSTGMNIQDTGGTDIVFIGYDQSADNDAPAAEDTIVQLGSQCEPQRSYAIIDFITEQRTSYYYGISSYSLPEHEVMRLSPFGSWVYTQFFEMRVGTPTDWHPQTDYRGMWDANTDYTYYMTVTHDGLLWMHNRKGYVSHGDEPDIYSDVWTLVTGGGDLKIQFFGSTGVVSSRGCDVQLEAHLMMAGRDITDTMLANSLNVMTWTRDSGVPGEDRAWTPTTGETKNILLISHHQGGRTDLGSQWLQTLSCKFTFTVTLKNKLGTEQQTLSATIPVSRPQ